MEEAQCEWMHGMMGQMSGMMGGGSMGPWMVLWGLLLVVVVVVAAVVAVRASSQSRTGGADALRELELRYARGDIERDDYLQRRDDFERR